MMGFTTRYDEQITKCSVNTQNNQNNKMENFIQETNGQRLHYDQQQKS